MSVKISYIVSSIGIILFALLMGISLSIKMSLFYAILVTSLLIAIIVALVFFMIKFIERKSKLEYLTLFIYFAIVCAMYCLCINELYGIFSSQKVLQNTAKEDIKQVNLCCDSIRNSIVVMCSNLKYCVDKSSGLKYGSSVEEYVADRFHNGNLKTIKQSKEENKNRPSWLNSEDKWNGYPKSHPTLGITDNDINLLRSSINNEFKNIAKGDGIYIDEKFHLKEPDRTVVELYAFNKTCSNINLFFEHILSDSGFCDTYLRVSYIYDNMLCFMKFKVEKPKLGYQNKFKEMTAFSYAGFIITIILQILIISPYICVKAISVKENKKKMNSEEFEIV